ncbi:hypothetical protein [Denitrobaculum tricleocarpae]|uniref:Uncharacterized protein n=1 Tax=Denitrobaculum tricleocarpae TaxID=2591009 RepID=A0A545TT09_9PROT|nr:hypothetical protein [Denitrobaculum tricleocarpae]TQV80353.1 hypothetical protein FKG95_09160 [Denitrobaculum tricleocarpae]
MTTLKQKLVARVAELNATMEDNSGPYDVDFIVDAPIGFVFSATDLHYHCHSQPVGPWGRNDLYRDMLERIEPGLRPCEVEPCEICNPLMAPPHYVTAIGSR